MTEIRKGLTPGQQVVVSGQFLLDSDASLKGATTRLTELPASAPAALVGEHRGEGRIEAIAPDEIMLSHDPIPSAKWDRMTMGFLPPAGGWPAAIKVGDRVSFSFRQKGAGEFEILSVSPAAGGAQGAPVATAPAKDPHAGRAPAAGAKP